MRKSHRWLIAALAVILVVGVGVTVALLVSSTNPIVNTFTFGGVNITLTETTGTEYTMTPGVPVKKDPTVTVLADSETSWLFVKVDKQHNFDAFCVYEMEDGWTALDGQEGVYGRLVEKSMADQVFPVLKDNRILVRDTVTEEQLAAVSERPTLTFTAYAIQGDSLTNAADAWRTLNQRKGE